MTYFSRASSLACFDTFAARNGLDAKLMLKAASLSPDVLDHPESLIAYQRIERLLNVCAEASGNPLFGLEYGLYQGVRIFGPLLYLLKNAETVEGSLAELARYYHLHSSGALVSIEQQGRLVVMSYRPVAGADTQPASDRAGHRGRQAVVTHLAGQTLAAGFRSPANGPRG